MKNPITAFRDSFNNIMFTLGRIDAKLDSITANVEKMTEKQKELNEELKEGEKPKEVD